MEKNEERNSGKREVKKQHLLNRLSLYGTVHIRNSFNFSPPDKQLNLSGKSSDSSGEYIISTKSSVAGSTKRTKSNTKTSKKKK